MATSMNKTQKTLTAAGIFLTVVGAVIGARVDAASAVKISGVSAMTALGSNQSCSKYLWGGLINNCGSTQSYAVPLPFTTSGSKSVSFRAKGSTSSNNVSCRGISMSDSGGSYYSTSWGELSSFGSMQTVSLGSMNVVGTGSVYLHCDIDDGGKLFLVTWDE